MSIRRLLAFSIDIALLIIVLSLIQYIVSLHLLLFSDIDTLSINNMLFTLTCAYFIIGDSTLMRNATIGKRVLKLRVVTSDRTFLSLAQTSVRVIILLLFPWLASNFIINFAANKGMSYDFFTRTLGLWLTVNLSFFLIPPISVLLGNGIEGLHDKICNVLVVLKNGPVDFDHQHIDKQEVAVKMIFISIIISIIFAMSINALGILLVSSIDGKSQFTNIILDGKSNLKMIYGIVPEKYVFHGFNEEGEVFSANIRESIPTREKIGEKLELPFYARDSLVEFRIIKGFTATEIGLFRMYEQERNKKYVVYKGTPFIRVDAFLTNKAMRYREIYTKIINNTINNIRHLIRDGEHFPLIIIKLIHKEKVGWISFELSDEIYYFSQQGVFRDENEKTRAITLAMPFTPIFDKPTQLNSIAPH